MDKEIIKQSLGVHPGFPKPGITFLDIFPLLADPLKFEILITHLMSHITSHTIPQLGKGGKVDAVVGLDARGFLLGPILAMRLGAAFVPVRKGGKLPGQCSKVEYTLEYGKDVFEMQQGTIKPGQNVIVIDDLIATGGSATAAGQLIKQAGGTTLEYLFIVALPFLKGLEKLDAPAYFIVEGED
ncbi:hypothetical protein E3P89_02812 [Wallemia ichthyophaga]|uniref:adenine phosphoribosyltransferase n=1 Tax=Wallemia ichthyophaga TaxID=245174 RepID=A0A4T0H835_WALIC|nr:hypothetical protein E3P91_01982 [Wallemia ichthyophaga]TIA80076.1 hypothetical protein E3P98_02902 [Wallemia ichthyophaga]TIB04481.1 hypothetical protein E3P96_01608 [Wallemia ichthyophaga]TIB10534.1 hypothetical protein E3P90_02828 [Wallemia ichthyophaga]TIB10623.1 hypothetical protein E3P93_02836 [Wallemia ichthyophaga]